MKPKQTKVVGWLNKHGYVVATSLPQRIAVMPIKEYGGEAVEVIINKIPVKSVTNHQK